MSSVIPKIYHVERFDLINEPTLQYGLSHKYIKESGPKSMTYCVKDLDRMWTKSKASLETTATRQPFPVLPSNRLYLRST